MAKQCPVPDCGHVCEQSYACCECGKLFDGSERETEGFLEEDA